LSGRGGKNYQRKKPWRGKADKKRAKIFEGVRNMSQTALKACEKNAARQWGQPKNTQIAYWN